MQVPYLLLLPGLFSSCVTQSLPGNISPEWRAAYAKVHRFLDNLFLTEHMYQAQAAVAGLSVSQKVALASGTGTQSKLLSFLIHIPLLTIHLVQIRAREIFHRLKVSQHSAGYVSKARMLATHTFILSLDLLSLRWASGHTSLPWPQHHRIPSVTNFVFPFLLHPTFLSAITAASTFNRDIIRQRAVAMGEEFRAKGRHIALGPMMNLMRIPAAGRNWEGYVLSTLFRSDHR